MEEIYSRNNERGQYPYSRTRNPVSLSESLRKIKSHGETGIIAEFKRLSPSGFANKNGLDIRDYFSSVNYGNIGGFSVLTEPHHFAGKYDDIRAVQDFGVPILDKDFISDEMMVKNAYNAGADAILLIMDFIDTGQLYRLADYAFTMGLESLIEFHDVSLAAKIRPGQGRLFGYNRRNLRSLKMEPEESRISDILNEQEISIVLESGIDQEYIRTHDLSRYAGLLIGTSILNGEMMFRHPHSPNGPEKRSK